jgi:hypothetical protein
MSSAVVQNCTQIKLATENPARTEFISKVAFCCGLGFLLFLAGMVAAINQSPPYHTVRDAWLALSAFGEQRELLASQWPAYTWMPAATSNKGLVTNQPGQTSGDYTLYTSGHSGDVMLLDMGGNLVHRWEAGFRKVWPSAPHVPSWLPEHFVYVRRAHATPNGDLLALYETTTNTPSGCGLAKLDRTGNVLWTFDANAHHDFCIDTSGRIYVLTHQIRRITDTDTKKSYLMGNQGSAAVRRVANASGVSFIEITGTGNVMTTSITNGGISVHSRHLNACSEMIASQYFGNCKTQ